MSFIVRPISPTESVIAIAHCHAIIGQRCQRAPPYIRFIVHSKLARSYIGVAKWGVKSQLTYLCKWLGVGFAIPCRLEICICPDAIRCEFGISMNFGWFWSGLPEQTRRVDWIHTVKVVRNNLKVCLWFIRFPKSNPTQHKTKAFLSMQHIVEIDINLLNFIKRVPTLVDAKLLYIYFMVTRTFAGREIEPRHFVQDVCNNLVEGNQVLTCWAGGRCALKP